MQLCNLHLVVCVNQSHHILRLARQWKFPICNAYTRWALFQISFRPQQEIGGKWGDLRETTVYTLDDNYKYMSVIGSLATCDKAEVSLY